MESCYGCGIRTKDRHPWVAVMQDVESEPSKVSGVSNNGFMAVSVCPKCHKEPENRTVTIKGTFFAREAMPSAVRLAGSAGVSL